MSNNPYHPISQIIYNGGSIPELETHLSKIHDIVFCKASLQNFCQMGCESNRSWKENKEDISS
jgi:2-hydroxy-3-keto-5-methylthiopentenyl-1-phosphate phosphatase